MLARSQLVLERSADSAASYRRLLALEEGGLEDWRNFATALITAGPSDKFPSDKEFLAALDEIDKRAPGDAMVLFYRGGAAREAGDPARAVELWTALLDAMPADAPVRGTLISLIEEARAQTATP
jgi:cytochrome c-type biogenesis protein CcmH/NrfG